MNLDRILKLVGPKLSNDELDTFLSQIVSLDHELSSVKVGALVLFSIDL